MGDEIKVRLEVVDEKIDRLVQATEKVSEKLSQHDIHFAEYNASLKEHMRRTELLELSLEDHKKTSQENHLELEKELAPILERETFKKQLKKYILAAGALAGAGYAILKLLEIL